jgi:signal transduction histidine kinase
MADEIERVIGISEKLLLLSKADANMLGHDLSDFEFSAFVQNLAEESTHYHPEIQVEYQIEPYVVWRCDRALVEQMVHNLYANAIKYNKPQGWIKFHLQRSGDVLTLEIENSASNIPDDLKEKAFDRFYRGDSSHNRAIDGMGLGLSICKEIASLHHGSLTIEPTPQQTVIVKLQAPLYKRSVSHMTSESSKNQG